MSRADRELRAACRQANRSLPELDIDAAWGDHRYILYSWRDGGIERVAACDDAAAIGVAMVTMAEDNRVAGLPADLYGVRDAHERRWIAIPFLPRSATPFH